MADELRLDYEALDAAAKRFGELSDDMSSTTVPGCDTGIVDIASAISAINSSALRLSTTLGTLSDVVREVKTEVITVDEDQGLRYPRTPFDPTAPGPLPWGRPAPAEPLSVLEPSGPPSYVHPVGPFGPPRLDLPDELTPQGPRVVTGGDTA